MRVCFVANETIAFETIALRGRIDTKIHSGRARRRRLLFVELREIS
jgi:hypothetical protein